MKHRRIKNLFALQYLQLWLTNKSKATLQYGDIELWDTSKITDMSKLLYEERRVFNENISQWDVSNVTNMSAMFHNSIHFNQPLNDWDVVM